MFGRLYAQIYDKKNQLKVNEEERSKQEVKDCTFKPKIREHQPRKGSPDTQKSRDEQDVFNELYIEGKNKLEQRRRSMEAEQHHQLRQLEFCTFAPQINVSKDDKRGEGELFDRLYQDSKEYKRKSYERKLKQEREAYSECRFVPKIRSTSKEPADTQVFNKLYE